MRLDRGKQGLCMQAMAMQVIDNVEEEDDLSPLLTALGKADERLQRLTKAREQEEIDALGVAELAIAKRDTLENAKTEIVDTERTMRKREEQLKKMAKQKESIEVEMDRCMESDSLTSVDSPAEADAASVGAVPLLPSCCITRVHCCQ
jgi:exonuclease V gamma subunit